MSQAVELARRQHVRLPVLLPAVARMTDSESGEVQGTVRNVSAGGILAEFPVEMPPVHSHDNPGLETAILLASRGEKPTLLLATQGHKPLVLLLRCGRAAPPRAPSAVRLPAHTWAILESNQ